MQDKQAKLDTSIRNSGFSMLLCCVLGFVLLEAFLVNSGGKPRAHAFVVLVGALAAFMVYRGLAPYSAASVSARAFSIVNIACGALLLIFGYVGMAALASGSITLFALFAVCAGIIPWSSIALSRACILAPTALVAAGVVIGMLTVRQLPQPIFFLLAVWMSWMVGVFSWVMNISYRQRKSKAARLLAQRTEQEPAKALRN